jgi:uncharacterized protein (DUF1697 family)
VPRIVAFLRAINVGGRFLKMAELAAHFSSLGLSNVATYINSGNVLFDSRVTRLDRLESTLERDLEPLLGFRSEVFLRTAGEVHAVADAAKAHRGHLRDEGEVNVAFLRKPLEADQVATLASLRTDRDDFAHGDREIYWLCQGKQSESSFSNAVLERRLRLRTTFRRVSMLVTLSEQLRSSVDA